MNSLTSRETVSSGITVPLHSLYNVRTNNSIRQNTAVFIKVPIWQWSRATCFGSSESSSGPQDTDLISYVVVSLLHCGIPNAYKLYIRWVLIYLGFTSVATLPIFDQM